MANVAENTPRGTVIDMESYRTSSPERAEEATPPRTQSGLASIVTAPSDTKDRSGVLSDDERLRVAKIKRDIERGFLFSFQDAVFLLEMVERMSR